ncbi:T6SS effector BTH_I2691 family protein [[Pseudomonas] boreopolis]|uniref:T6SS effector BTH_I2691 family protein n=1 Tax=Xanthomonas boreopolis TaxID=86183 RepID=UPI003DA1A27F
MNTANTKATEDLCPNCTKVGLPIFPLRYAIARNDASVKEKAPELKAPFGEGVTSIALPSASASYTLRTLREGYLYMFNEARGEWKAFEVDRHGVLFEFDIRKPAPAPADDDNYREVCSRDGNPPLSGCVVVPDASKAGKVWFGFTTIPWTRRTWEKNKLQKNREKHMRWIDVGKWISSGGEEQPHLAPLSRLKESVGEFAMTPPLPSAGETEAERQAREQRNEAARRADPKNPTIELEPVTVVAADYPAFNFSLFDFHNRAHEAEDLLAAAQAAGERGRVHTGGSKGFVPAMIALTDPGALGSELNELAKEKTRDWLNNPQRKRRHESATMIEAVRQAVQNGGEINESEARKTTVGILGAIMPATVGTALGGKPGIAGVAEGMRRAGRLSPRDLDEVHERSWKKYRKMYNHAAVDNYFRKEFPGELDAFAKANIAPLDQAYIGWLGSPMLRDWMNLNADETDLRSGLAYAHTLFVVIQDALGRTKVCKYMGECFQLDPTSENAIFSRAMIFNQDKLASAWAEAANDVPTPASGWDGVVNRLWSGFNALLTSAGEGIAEAAKKMLSSYMYEYSAVLSQRLHAVFDATTGELIAGVVERRAIVIIGAAAKVDSPRGTLITVRSRMTEMQAMYVASGVAEAAASGRPSFNTGDNIRDAFQPGGKRVTMQGIIMVDEHIALRTQGVVDLLPEQMQGQLQRNLRRGIVLEGSTHIASALLSLWTLTVAYRDFDKQKGGALSAVTANYIGACAATAGATLEGIGALLKATRFGNAALPSFASRLMPELASRAAVVSLFGRLAGAAGGAITGLLMMYEGASDLALDPVYGITMIILGGGIIWVSYLVASLALTGPMGFLVALLIALFSLVVGFMKKDAIERWLDKAIDFGNHAKGSFSSEKTQWDEMRALGSN